MELSFKPKQCVRFSSIVVLCLLSAGCSHELRSLLDPQDPIVVTLQEKATADREEIWLSFRGAQNVDGEGGPVWTDNAHRDRRNGDVERIYYVYLCPNSRKQHTWNIETDEPNVVFRFYQGNREILKQHPGLHRDAANRLLPPGTSPPPMEVIRTPWYASPFFYLFVVVFIVMPAVITYRFQNSRKRRPSN